jgi:hypothetical protein
MCVAIYKPKETILPSLEILKQCWDANPDGAGFALFTGGEKYAIEIHKGYMTWKSFVTAYEKYLADFDGDLLLHFRIATHGGISSGLTHPFSLTKDVKLLKHTNVLTNYALIHNGMLPIESEEGSDTMEFCRRLAPLYRDIPAAFNLIEGMAGNNKIAVMTSTGVHLFGEWECIDGVYFSNLLWDWQDDFYLPTRKELRQLNKGYCPYCDGKIIPEDDLFYCPECCDVWMKEVDKIAF